MKKFIHILLLFIIIALSGCSSGGGVVGDYLDDKDDSSLSPTVSAEDTNSTVENQLYLVKQFNLTADVYQDAIDDLQSTTLKSLRGVTLYSNTDDVISILQDVKAKYETKANEILAQYNLSSLYSSYSNDSLNTFITSIKQEIQDALTQNNILKSLAKLEEENISKISTYSDDITELSDSSLVQSKNNFGIIVTELYKNNESYTPQILTDEQFNTVVNSDLTYFGDATEDNFNIANTVLSDVTKVSVSTDIGKPLFLSDKVLRDSLFYITKQEELSNKVFSTFINHNKLDYASDELDKIYSAELTHFNNGANLMISEYSLSDEFDGYVNNTLNSIYTDINNSITTESTAVEVLKALALLEERSIYDLNLQIEKVTADSDIYEMYQKLLVASKNHLNLLVSLIYNENGTYSKPQLIDQELYDEIAGNTTPANITVDSYSDVNNIVTILVNKTNQNSLSLNDNIEKESLMYIGYLEKKISDMFYLLKSYDTTLNVSSHPVSIMFDAENSHYNAVKDLAEFYGIEDDFTEYINTGLKNFQDLVYLDTPDGSDAKTIISAMVFMKEKAIKDLASHIANNGSTNEYLVTLYTALLEGSKDHIKLLAEILFDPDKGYDTTYLPSLLSQAEYNSIVGTLGDVEIVVVVDNTVPNIKYYATYDEYNNTSLSLSILDVQNAPYSEDGNEYDKNALAYIAQQEKLTTEVFQNYLGVIYDAGSSFLIDNTYFKEQLVYMNQAETTHINIIDNSSDEIDTMLDIYGTNIGAYQELAAFAENIIDDGPLSITNEDDYIDMLNQLAFMLERSIFDLEDYLSSNKMNITEIKELFTRLLTASKNHFRYIIHEIKTAQGTYNYKLLGAEQICGGLYLADLCPNNNSIDENIDVYLYVTNDGVSDVSISEKPVGGELKLTDISEKNSLRYIDALITKSSILTNTVYTDGGILSGDAIYDIFKEVIRAKAFTHIETTDEALSIYGITSAISSTDQDSIDLFNDLITNKLDNATTASNKLNILGLIEERNIQDLEDHIANTVDDNNDLINTYTALLKASKNHLMIIDKILLDNFTEEYTCQLLDEELCSSFLPFADEFIRGSIITQP